MLVLPQKLDQTEDDLEVTPLQEILLRLEEISSTMMEVKEILKDAIAAEETQQRGHSISAVPNIQDAKLRVLADLLAQRAYDHA